MRMRKNKNLIGILEVKQWADDLGIQDGQQKLAIPLTARPQKLAHSNATGKGLVTNGYFGVDEIQLKAGDKFVPHTHPGDHILIIIAGKGTITYDGKVYPTKAGDVYMIEGEIPHGVGAITDHVILAVGTPHKPVDSPDRMKPIAYEAVTSKIGNMHCLICNIEAKIPEMLHDKNCNHCPCDNC